MSQTIFIASVGLATSVGILFLIRRDHMHAALGLGWAVAAILIAIMAIFPTVLAYIADLVGIYHVPSLAFFLSISAIAIKLVLNDLEVSRLKLRQLRALQKIAMLEAEIEKFDADPRSRPGKKE